MPTGVLCELGGVERLTAKVAKKNREGRQEEHIPWTILAISSGVALGCWPNCQRAEPLEPGHREAFLV